jgi:hypothetical protein
VFEQSEFAFYLNEGVGFIDKLQFGANIITFVLFWFPCSTNELYLLWWNPHSRQKLPSPTLSPLAPSHHGLVLLYHESLEGI